MKLLIVFLTQNTELTFKLYERILTIMLILLSSVFFVIILYDLSKRLTHKRSLFLDDMRYFLENSTLKSIVSEDHSQKVAAISFAIAEAMGLSKKQQEEVRIAGLVHDVGKMRVPDAILNKKEKLNEEEWAIIKNHCKIGYDILLSMDKTKSMAKYSLQHHERIDGNGYPNNIQGNNIALFSKIISIADAYDAMTSDRAYRKAMTKEQAIVEINNCSGTQFDPSIVKVFTKSVVTKI
ncbi:MAG: HD-GYP domain-containing protein [Clostridia bacterium]|nr:HD-GYP domain-containing protein [Clostridia bacterium]